MKKIVLLMILSCRRGVGIEDVVTLSAWECGSYLYEPQEFEIYLYPTRSKYDTKEMARIDQGLRVGSTLSPGKGECGCGCVESQGSLQLLASYAFYWRGI
jgi:hypothetical protein